MPGKSASWDTVKRILGAALERDPGQRSSFIVQACGGDDALRAEVESLAAHHDSADSILECSSIAGALSFQPDALVGRRIGAYRIVRTIGHGGMAVVYLGERDDEHFRKSVAIKMVRPGPHGEEIFRRFRNERQTLAAIDHPNIVKLLDGGNTEEGLPYLVMDYVDGVPIDQYCDDHRLSIEERLRLFCTVCSAVQYAHEKSIIHRDLKPANILITKEGVARLLDFGIAKLLSPEVFMTALVTQTSWRPMTPEYASPEQVRGQQVTKASDIYSLGVLLYYLLTGHRPYRSAGTSILEVERAICEEETPAPSTVVGEAESRASPDGDPSVEAPQLLSENRVLAPGQLRRRLQGDLDTIVMKALRKEPQNRYLSVTEFANDIERHLAGQAVAARRLTVAYRGARFLRRHKESLGTAATLLVLMAGLALWETLRSGRPAAQLSPHAQSGSRSSLAILGFKNLSGRPDTAWVSTALTEMLATELGAGEKLRVVPAETVARTKIDLALTDTQSLAADALARLRRNFGSDFLVLGSYLDLGKAEAPGDLVRLDLRLEDAARGETVVTLSEIGAETDLPALVSRAGKRLRQQMGIADISQFDSTGIRASVPSNPDAVRFYAEGLAKLRAFDALAARDLLLQAVTADPSYPLAHSALARAWMTLGYDQNSVAEARKALDLAGKLSRSDHALAEARYFEASKDWEKAIETYRALLGSFPDSMEYGLSLANAQIAGEHGSDALATIAKLRGLSQQAKEDPRVDLAEAQAAYSLSDHKRVLLATGNAVKKANASGAKLLAARALILQCRELAALGQSRQSLSAGAEARRIYHEAGDFGGEAQALHSMAEVPINQGDLQQAKELYQLALDLVRRIGDKRATARELGNIGLIFVQEGDFAAGEKIYAEALADFRDVGDRHGMSVVIGNTGDIRHAEGRLGEALAEYRDALMLAREVGHRSSEAINLQLMGAVLADQGELAAAMRMYQQAAAIQREIDDKHYYADTLVCVGRLQRQEGDSEGSKKTYEEALGVRRQLGEKGMAAEIDVALGELAGDTGDGALEEKLAREAVQEFQAEKEADNELQAWRLLIASLLQQGKFEQVKEAVKSALVLYDKSRDVTARLPFEVENVYARAATGDPAGAQQLARNAELEAEKYGLARIRLEALLAGYEIRMKERNSAAVRVQLGKLADDARAEGFELIARKASALSAPHSHS